MSCNELLYQELITTVTVTIKCCFLCHSPYSPHKLAMQKLLQLLNITKNHKATKKNMYNVEAVSSANVEVKYTSATEYEGRLHSH